MSVVDRHPNSFKIQRETESYILRQGIKKRAANGRHDLHEGMVEIHDGKVSKLRDDYELPTMDNVLGEGLCGKVVVAIHRITKRRYACKILRLNRIQPNRLAELRREIGIMMKLDHPNIVKLYEVFEEEDKIFLIMELLEGGELFDRLASQDAFHFSERTAAVMVRKMLSAIRYTHIKGICHRDLKLENIMFDSKRTDAEIKLIDFGLSLKFRGGVMNERLGTPYYIAPEV
eukprot:g4241.t1